MPSDELTTVDKIGVAAVLLLITLYSVVILQELLAAVWFLLVGATLYLGWRFVRAFERVAAAMED